MSNSARPETEAKPAEPTVQLRASADGDAALARIEALAELPAVEACAAFPSGRSVELQRAPGGMDAITVRSPQGQVELSVRFTPEGPVLRFAAAEIELDSRGPMRLACESLAVEARQGIALEAGGDVVQRAHGDHRVEAGGALQAEGHKVDVRARRGDVTVRANDDVRIDGERVLLNS
jgi:hypothetical protein